MRQPRVCRQHVSDDRGDPWAQIDIGWHCSYDLDRLIADRIRNARQSLVHQCPKVRQIVLAEIRSLQLSRSFRADTLESGQRRLLAAVKQSIDERSPQSSCGIELIDRILPDENTHRSRGPKSDGYQFVQTRYAEFTSFRHRHGFADEVFAIRLLTSHGSSFLQFTVFDGDKMFRNADSKHGNAGL